MPAWAQPALARAHLVPVGPDNSRAWPRASGASGGLRPAAHACPPSSPPHPHVQWLNYVTIQPPVLPIKGLRGAVGWLKVVICTSDVWLLHSAGLDALVLQKSHALGMQLFIPMAVLGCCMREYSAKRVGGRVLARVLFVGGGARAWLSLGRLRLRAYGGRLTRPPPGCMLLTAVSWARVSPAAGRQPRLCTQCCASVHRAVMPLQIAEAFENGDATFSRLTMANIDPQSDILWAHW